MSDGGYQFIRDTSDEGNIIDVYLGLVSCSLIYIYTNGCSMNWMSGVPDLTIIKIVRGINMINRSLFNLGQQLQVFDLYLADIEVLSHGLVIDQILIMSDNNPRSLL